MRNSYPSLSENGMAGEVTIARESGAVPLNAKSNARLKAMSFSQMRKTLRKSDGLMPASGTKEHFANLATQYLKRTKESRKDFLHHATNKSELLAARHIWNHPEEMRHVRTSPFGEGKDVVKDKASLDKKRSKGIIQYEEYGFKYGSNSFKVKTARYKNGQETLYHIEKAKR